MKQRVVKFVMGAWLATAALRGGHILEARTRASPPATLSVPLPPLIPRVPNNRDGLGSSVVSPCYAVSDGEVSYRVWYFFPLEQGRNCFILGVSYLSFPSAPLHVIARFRLYFSVGSCCCRYRLRVEYSSEPLNPCSSRRTRTVWNQQAWTPRFLVPKRGRFRIRTRGAHVGTPARFRAGCSQTLINLFLVARVGNNSMVRVSGPLQGCPCHPRDFPRSKFSRLHEDPSSAVERGSSSPSP